VKIGRIDLGRNALYGTVINRETAQMLIDKAQLYEERASRWLADANEQAEKGNKDKAEKLYDKAQYWLDKANVERGWN
jgi:hypothetical protein